MSHLKISLRRRRRRPVDTLRETGTGAKDAARRDPGYAVCWPQFRFVERSPR
jgi:hypothetical protein